MCEVVE